MGWNETAIDLTGTWKISYDAPYDAQSAKTDLDDSSWKRMRIGIYNVPDNTDAHHVIFRKTFRVPENWDHGRVLPVHP